MSPQIVCLIWSVCTVALLHPAPVDATGFARECCSSAKPPVSVGQWLVLGPVADALPVFHAESPGGYDLDALRTAERLAARSLRPAEGGVEQWFGGEQLTWSARASSSDGTVRLAPPATMNSDQTGVAWLATYVAVERFSKLKVTLRGTHIRTISIDGNEIASANSSDVDKEAETKLIAGKHLIVVKAIRDPASDAEWAVGVGIETERESSEPHFSLDSMRDVTIHDIIDAPTIGSVAISPDGQLVATSVGRFLPGTDDRESWVEVRDTDNGNLVRTWRGGQMSQVAWAPSGRTVSYVTSHGSGDNRTSTLWLADLNANTVVPLLERVEDFSGYRWAPDGSSIVFMTSVNAEDDPRGIKRLEGLMDRWATYRDKTYLSLVTVPGGTTRRLTAGALSTDFNSFSPDGRRMLFTRTIEDLSRRPFDRTELWEMDLTALQSELVQEFGWMSSASYSPDGNSLLIQGGAVEFDSIGLNIPDGTIANTYDNQLFIWDRLGETADPITRDFDPAVSSATWSAADGNIYIVAEDRDYRKLFRYDVEQRTFTPIETGFEAFSSLAVASDAAVVVGTGTSPWVPQGLVTVDIERDSHSIIHRPGEEWFRDVRMGTVEPWTFTASSGKTIDGRVYLPPNFDSSKRYPVIVNYYGGTSPTGRSFGGRYPKEYWAAHGYLVYVPQPSGATGYGQAFSAVHVNDWGKTTVDEIVEGTQQFLREHPFVDPDRVGNIGASYGGFMTMLLSTKTEVFSASVAHAGISALSSYWGEGYWGYSYSAVATAESYPWNRPDIYVDQSPLFRADQNSTPILLTHGSSDTNVPVGESDQFYIALKLLGKDVEYLQVAGQDHWILDHAKRIVWSRSILAWYDRWLKDDAAWWEDLYPERR